MEKEMKESGVSLGEIWRAGRKKLWLVLCASLVVAISALLVFRYIINPSNAAYQLEFTLTYPGSETMKYPDGTPFYFQDIISLPALERAKASDERFAGINITKMFEEDDITLAEDEGKYTLTVVQSYFKQHTLATDFLRAVANVPVEVAKEKAGAIDYMLDKDVFEGADFEDRIKLLVEQKESILTLYDEWIASYRDTYNVSGRTLMSHRAEAVSVFGDAVRTELLEELRKNGYTANDPDRLEEKRAQLAKEKAENEARIAEIEKIIGKSSSVGTAYASQSDSSTSSTDAVKGEGTESLEKFRASLIQRNWEIDSQLDGLKKENIEAFEKRIWDEYDKLSKSAETVGKVAAALYAQEAGAGFETTRANVVGGTNLAIVGIGVFILSFVVLGAIVCAVELRGERKTAQKSDEE